jgi:predicted ArsR family transcriptional regulator
MDATATTELTIEDLLNINLDGLTVKEIAVKTGMSIQSTRRHLTVLVESQVLTVSKKTPARKGGPEYIYKKVGV